MSQFWVIEVTSWCRRVFLVKQAKQPGRFCHLVLKPSEIDDSRKFLIRETQAEAFTEDLKRLNDSQEVARKSTLFRLVAFLDGEDLIRLTGRLYKSSLDSDFKH